MIKVSVMHPNNAGAHFKLWGAHPTLTGAVQHRPGPDPARDDHCLCDRKACGPPDPAQDGGGRHRSRRHETPLNLDALCRGTNRCLCRSRISCTQSRMTMTQILIAARAALILWVNLAVMPAEFVFDAIEAELKRQGVEL